jgi:hypothetical protein
MTDYKDLTDYRNTDLIRRNSLLMAMSIHPSESIEDAMTMLDSRLPLTYGERKLIVQSLWDLAFREGARQGRLAGIEHVHNTLREEYEDPTTAIRANLTKKARIRDGLPPVPTTDNFAADFTSAYPER